MTNWTLTFEDVRAVVASFKTAKGLREVADEVALKREMASGNLVKRAAQRADRIWELR